MCMVVPMTQELGSEDQTDETIDPQLLTVRQEVEKEPRRFGLLTPNVKAIAYNYSQGP